MGKFSTSNQNLGNTITKIKLSFHRTTETAKNKYEEALHQPKYHTVSLILKSQESTPRQIVRFHARDEDNGRIKKEERAK